MKKKTKQKEKTSFYKLPKIIFSMQLRASEFYVLSYLCAMRNNKTGCAYPSIATICTQCGLSERTVHEAIRTLAGCGLITIEPYYLEGTDGKRRQTSNRYYLNLFGEPPKPLQAEAEEPTEIPQLSPEENPFFQFCMEQRKKAAIETLKGFVNDEKGV